MVEDAFFIGKKTFTGLAGLLLPKKSMVKEALVCSEFQDTASRPPFASPNKQGFKLCV